MRVYRQGDVVLAETRFIPEAAREVGGSLRIEGETGNIHELVGDYKVMRADRRLYVVVEAPSRLTHPQHGDLVVEPGKYEVRRVRSFSYAAWDADTAKE